MTEKKQEKNRAFTLDDLKALLRDIEENGGRILTAEQEEFFKKNDIAVEYIDNKEGFTYLIIPAESQLLMEEQMNGIVAAAENAPTATMGTAGSAGSAGSFFTVSSASTCSCFSTAGTAGSAGSAGSVGACAMVEKPATEIEQADSNAFASMVSSELSKVNR